MSSLRPRLQLETWRRGRPSEGRSCSMSCYRSWPSPCSAGISGRCGPTCCSASRAARLFITEATVKTHLLNIYAKLGVSDRAAAVAEAFNRGLLNRRP